MSGDSVGRFCYIKEGRVDAKVKLKPDLRRQIVPGCARAEN